MSLTKKEVVDLMEITEDGSIQIRKATVIEEDGKEINRSFHRHVISPGDDVSNEAQRVKDVAGVIHTAQAVAAYQAKQNANENSPVN